jgi:hypothetical protein
LNYFFASNEKCVVVLLIYEKIVGKNYFYVVIGDIVVNYKKNIFRLIYELEYYHNVKKARADLDKNPVG